MADQRMARWLRGGVPAPAGPGALLLLALGAACGPAHEPPQPPGELLDEVTFTRYTPLSSNLELARRALPPLTVRDMRRAIERGQALAEQAVDLSRERFTVYVPAGPPPKEGYGLLVYVAPWAEPTRPKRWRPPLDRHGLIFVSATNSGNDAKMLDRRLPLALLAWENVRARYPIDARRVYVGGFSGGSRTALVAALAYPDVFRGALLNAGADPIGGERGIYLPPADLFRSFQSSRLVLVTGDEDVQTRDDDRLTLGSLQSFCVFGAQAELLRRTGHSPLDAAALDRALEALERPVAAGSPELDRCNSRLQAELAGRLAEVEAALARGDRDAARARLKAVDARFGGLGAPATAALADRLEGSGP